MQRLTDDFGVWQHSLGGEIDYEKGYALDDSARALLVYLLFNDQERAAVCLNYLAASQVSGGFVGFFDKNRQPLDQHSSADAHGLSAWALATAIKNNFKIEVAQAIWNKAASDWPVQAPYLRTTAYLLIAFSELNEKVLADKLAARLITKFDYALGWFEPTLTYANAVLPLALLRYSAQFGRLEKLEKLLKQATTTLETYCRIGVIPAPVGNRIWQKVGAVERDIYGQQPIDAGFMTMLLTEMAENYQDKDYAREAREWLDWFSGNNIYRTSLLTEEFACADGLDEPGKWGDPIGVHLNYGSESTIMYLLAYAAVNQDESRKH